MIFPIRKFISEKNTLPRMKRGKKHEPSVGDKAFFESILIYYSRTHKNSSIHYINHKTPILVKNMKKIQQAHKQTLTES
jgi:hypothetical protein